MCDDLPTSENLLGSFYGCDEDAFTVLYRRYEKRLARFTARCLHASPRAAATKALRLDLVPDVVQKTFRNVSRTKHEANGRWREEKGKVDQWLFTICRNAAADSLDTLDQQTLEVSLPDGLVSVVKGPFSEQEREILWDWVDNLPQGHRDVILLKYRYKMKQTDIAQRLNKSEAWVSQIHAEALALLKNRW